MTMYVQLFFFLFVSSFLPAALGVRNFSVGRKFLGSVLVALGIWQGPILFMNLQVGKLEMVLGLVTVTMLALYSVFSESRLALRDRFVLGAFVAAANAVLAGIMVSDLLNLRLGPLADDTMGGIIGFTVAAVIVNAAFRCYQRRRES